VQQPLIARVGDVALGAERLLAVDALRALVDDVARVAVIRAPVVVAFDEVLLDLRPDRLNEEPQVPGDGVVAQDRMPALDEVVDRDSEDQEEQDGAEHTHHAAPGQHRQGRQDQQSGDHDHDEDRHKARAYVARAQQPPPIRQSQVRVAPGLHRPVAGDQADHRHLGLGRLWAMRLGHEPPTPGGPAMGEKTDKISGRAKQAAGAVTGDEETKREGERQENKGKLKGKLDSTVDKAQDALEDLKDNADRK
jgi:uncharacterized protein YjbJ (UPF0337 family)